MKITLMVELEGRTVVEQLTTKEDFRGDYRNAVGEAASRVELSTFGPQLGPPVDGVARGLFDEQLKMRGQQ